MDISVVSLFILLFAEHNEVEKISQLSNRKL